MAPAAKPPDPDPNPGPGAGDGDDPRDAAALAAYAQALADALVAAVPGWIERSVVAVLLDQRGDVTDEERAVAAQAGRRAATAAEPELRALLAADIDDQGSTPLAVVRRQVQVATEVLDAAGAHPVARDEFARRHEPEDRYGLVPATFADLDPALAEPGLEWGAAKAHVHLARRRRAGQR